MGKATDTSCPLRRSFSLLQNAYEIPIETKGFLQDSLWKQLRYQLRVYEVLRSELPLYLTLMFIFFVLDAKTGIVASSNQSTLRHDSENMGSPIREYSTGKYKLTITASIVNKTQFREKQVKKVVNLCAWVSNLGGVT